MAYFNKTDFRRLLRLWRRVMKDNKDEIIQRELARDDEWLMQNFLPIHFIDEIYRKDNRQ